MTYHRILDRLSGLGRLASWFDSTISRRFLNGGSKALAALAGFILVALMIMILMDVVSRHLSIRVPWVSNFEFAELAMAMLSYLALAWCWHIGAHIRIELLLDRYNFRIQAALSFLASLIGILCTIALAWSVWKLGIKSLNWGVTTIIQGVPVAPFQILFSIVMAHFTLVMVRSLWSYIAKARGRKFESWSCDVRDMPKVP